MILNTLDLLTETFIIWLIIDQITVIKVRKFNFMPKYSPKYFWQWIWWNGILLKAGSWCTDLTCFLENITSWACLLTSGLNDIFHLCAHSDIFCRSLFNTSAEVLLICTAENREYHQQRVLQSILCSLTYHVCILEKRMD